MTRHVLRNALLPMVTLIGLQAGTMLGGSVVVESVFSLPGLGRLAYESVVQRDLNTLLGIVFVSALLVIISQLRRRPDLCAARSAHHGGARRDGRDQALFPQSRRGRRPDPAADRDRDGDLGRLSLSARSAGAGRPPADLAVLQSALPARHRQFRARYRRADFLWRADFAADRRRRHRDRGPDRHPGRRLRRLLRRLGRQCADARSPKPSRRCRISCCCWCWSPCSARR